MYYSRYIYIMKILTISSILSALAVMVVVSSGFILPPHLHRGAVLPVQRSQQASRNIHSNSMALMSETTTRTFERREGEGRGGGGYTSSYEGRGGRGGGRGGRFESE